MHIDKSQIIGKSIKNLIELLPKSHLRTTPWSGVPSGTIDLLSSCTLRFPNSYGTTYQISQTKELTIISDKGQSYTLQSYISFVKLIIVDYQDPSKDKPMKIIKQSGYHIGDKVKIREDLSSHSNTTPIMCELAGTIVTITSPKGKVRYGYEFKGFDNYYWSADMFEGLIVEDTPQPTPANIKVGTHWERLKDFKGVGGYKAGEIVTLTKVTETFVNYSDNRGKSLKDFPKTFKPRADLDSPYAEALPQVDEALTVLTKNKSKPVAQPEPTKPTKSENTFMKAIKETALTTVDQNKQAAIIASKMEAGRILNKQIIKQVKPHIPMFFRGYLDTPLAPVILANLVTLAGNHTDNKRVKQISELMLLAAADTTVQSFNLDQIIDDILKNIKLPAGILDGNDDN